MHKSNKDIFLVCLINKMNEFYEESYTGPEKYRELMRAKHVEVIERTYFPDRYNKPGHPSHEEKDAFLHGVQRIVEYELSEMVSKEEKVKIETERSL